MKNLTLIELMLIVAIAGIVFNAASSGFEVYKEKFVYSGNKPVIEFHDTSKSKVVPQ